MLLIYMRINPNGEGRDLSPMGVVVRGVELPLS